MLQLQWSGVAGCSPTAVALEPAATCRLSICPGSSWAGSSKPGSARLPARAPTLCLCPLLQRPITLNGGMRMTGWYDIIDLDRIGSEHQDAAAMHESKRWVCGVGPGRCRVVRACGWGSRLVACCPLGACCQPDAC